MSARRGEAYYTSKIAKNVLSERADIMNYVPTKDVFLYNIYAFQVFENRVRLTLREGRRRKTEGRLAEKRAEFGR